MWAGHWTRFQTLYMQRYTFQYDHYMEIIVPIFLGLYGICEAVRLYLGWSGNLMERVRLFTIFSYANHA